MDTEFGFDGAVYGVYDRALYLHKNSQQQPHRVKSPRERIEDQSQILERHHAQQRLIARLSKDDRAVTFAHGKSDVTF